jgi:hypothetical protein
MSRPFCVIDVVAEGFTRFNASDRKAIAFPF